MTSSNRKRSWRHLDPLLPQELEKYGRAVPSREFILHDLEERGMPLTREEIWETLGLDDEWDDVSCYARPATALDQEAQRYGQKFDVVVVNFLNKSNATDRRVYELLEVTLSPEFQALWDRIKPKTTYRVEFQTDVLVERAVAAIRRLAPIQKPRIRITAGQINVQPGGVTAKATARGLRAHPLCAPCPRRISRIVSVNGCLI